MSLAEGIRRLSTFPADTLSLADRGRLRMGAFADVVVFDPARIQDHATFENPAQYATGVADVIVNGRLALEKGEPTAERPGRAVFGRALKTAAGGGCRPSSANWTWIP